MPSQCDLTKAGRRRLLLSGNDHALYLPTLSRLCAFPRRSRDIRMSRVPIVTAVEYLICQSL